MSLITRCPACGTMFNVVADQLKVSQGWVRCGQCSDVFDATLHLQNQGITPQPQVSKLVETESPPSFLPLDNSDIDERLPSYAEEVTAALKAPDEKAAPGFIDSLSPLNIQSASATNSQHFDQLDDISSEVPSDVSSDVSFVRDARRQAFWRKPVVRLVLGSASVLLTVLLILQVAVMQRDSLAVLEPRLKSVLQILCERLSCRVGPLRQIEAIVIDSSSFNKVNEAGVYRLNFALKNTGAAAVAMPSLEVTLTDSQDQPMLRSVLAPGQFGAGSAGGLLAAGAEFSGVLNLQLATNATPLDSTPTNLMPSNAAASPSAAMRVAGYRLLAFYP
jgi:predicted Zn finger-like uncharacterized protein